MVRCLEAERANIEACFCSGVGSPFVEDITINLKKWWFCSHIIADFFQKGGSDVTKLVVA